jgi:hypothetical protein
MKNKGMYGMDFSVSEQVTGSCGHDSEIVCLKKMWDFGYLSDG